MCVCLLEVKLDHIVVLESYGLALRMSAILVDAISHEARESRSEVAIMVSSSVLKASESFLCVCDTYLE